MSLLGRFVRYTRTHGPVAALKHTPEILHRLRFAGLQVLFSCDLPLANPVEAPLLTIEHLCADDPPQTARILRYGGEATVARQFRERFQLGARLHLAKVAGELVAFGWSIRARTVRPYFFPLSPTDVHLFDYVVFPEFRGQGINPRFLFGILAQLSRDGARRAFIECAAWNEPQLRSLARTPFRQIASVRCVHLARITMTQWAPGDHESLPPYLFAGPLSHSR